MLLELISNLIFQNPDITIQNNKNDKKLRNILSVIYKNKNF